MTASIVLYEHCYDCLLRIGLLCSSALCCSLRIITEPTVTLRPTVLHFAGRTIAAVAERVHFCRLDADATGDMRAVPRGLGLCERSGRVWLVSRRVVSLGRLRDGMLIKRLCVFDDDRLDSKNFVYLGKHKGPGSGLESASDKAASGAAGTVSTGLLGTETMTTPRAGDGRKASMYSVSSIQMLRRQSTIMPPAQDDSARQDEDVEALKKAREKATKKAEGKAHLAMAYAIDPLDMITATVTGAC